MQERRLQRDCCIPTSGREGVLAVQYGPIAKFSVVVAATLFGIYLWRDSPAEGVNQVTLAVITGVSFLLGAFCSALAG